MQEKLPTQGIDVDPFHLSQETRKLPAAVVQKVLESCLRILEEDPTTRSFRRIFNTLLSDALRAYQDAGLLTGPEQLRSTETIPDDLTGRIEMARAFWDETLSEISWQEIPGGGPKESKKVSRPYTITEVQERLPRWRTEREGGNDKSLKRLAYFLIDGKLDLDETLEEIFKKNLIEQSLMTVLRKNSDIRTLGDLYNVFLAPDKRVEGMRVPGPHVDRIKELFFIAGLGVTSF